MLHSYLKYVIIKKTSNQRGETMRNEYFNTHETLFDLHLVMCGNEKCTPDFHMNPHMRNYFLIHYINHGRGYYVENNNSHSIGPGDIFVIFPNTIISYYSEKEDPFDFCWVAFNGHNAKKYLECIGITEENLVVHLNNMDFFTSVNHMIECLQANKYTSEVMLNKHLLRCLRSVEKSINSHPQKNKSSINYYENAVLFIEANYMKPISASDVVNYLNLNRSHVHKIFKSYCGMSISQFILKYRINMAKDFLKHHDSSISQIAESVGINDIYYFSKLFKASEGMSPMQYKKLLKKNAL